MKARGNRDNVILASKVVGRTANEWFRGGRPSKLVRADIMDAIDKSLARLRPTISTSTRSIFRNAKLPGGANPTEGRRHGPPTRDADETPIAETLGVFDELVKAGKIRHLGLSNESSWGVMRYHRRSRHMASARARSRSRTPTTSSTAPSR